MNEVTPILVSREVAGKMLGVSTRAVDHMIADGRLVPTRLGWRTMISRKRLEAIAERGIVGNIRIN